MYSDCGDRCARAVLVVVTWPGTLARNDIREGADFSSRLARLLLGLVLGVMSSSMKDVIVHQSKSLISNVLHPRKWQLGIRA